MSTQTQRLTYEEYLKTPEIKARYDIVDGVMIMAPAPSINHQVVLGNLHAHLRQFILAQALGKVLFAPVDVIIQREPLRTRQPDLLFVSTERYSILGQMVEGAPDLVVEVLSPSNSRADNQAKLEDYGSLGVRECWLVSPEASSVEVLESVEGAWTRVAMCGLGDQVQSQVLSGLTLGVGEIFAS